CRAAPIFQAGTDQSKNPVIISPGGQPQLHEDEWTWRVVADANTLAYVIDLMHGGAVSTLEVPCIIGEDMYDALKKAQVRLAGAVGGGSQTDIGNAIFDMEALIVTNCLFTEVLDPLTFFPGPTQTFTDPITGVVTHVAAISEPGNLAQLVPPGSTATAIAGIIDTTEHPCCCKLLVDLEWISIKN